jgi:hypothetical protein
VRSVLLFALVLILAACSIRCERAEVVGVYGLDNEQDHYELRLGHDGLGVLTRDQVEIGQVQWELEPSNGQVFIRADRKVLDLLRSVAGDAPFPNDVAKWKSGYRGMMPRCDLNGAVNRLDLDVDGQKYFVRRQN